MPKVSDPIRVSYNYRLPLAPPIQLNETRCITVKVSNNNSEFRLKIHHVITDPIDMPESYS